MSHAWLIETLTELRSHAEQSGLPMLADHLETAIHLAHAEIASQEDVYRENRDERRRFPSK